MAEIVVRVNLKNQEQLLTKRTAPDRHYVSLIIGNSENIVVFQQKLTWGNKQMNVYWKLWIWNQIPAYPENLTGSTAFQ